MAMFNPNPNPGASGGASAGAPADANGDLCTEFTGLGIATAANEFSDKLAWLDPKLYVRLREAYARELDNNDVLRRYMGFVAAEQGARIKELQDKNNELTKALSCAHSLTRVTAGVKTMKKGKKAKGKKAKGKCRVRFNVPLLQPPPH